MLERGALVKQLLLVAIKFVATWFVIAIMFRTLGILYQPVWLYAVILTTVAYVVGDLVVLRHFGNTPAVIADILLTALTLWASIALLHSVGWIVPTISFVEALAVGVVIGAVEIFYHMLVKAQMHVHGQEPTD